MNSLFPDDSANAPAESLPAAISGLIDGAVASFDADRDASRRYLLRASALLRGRGQARVGADGSRKSPLRGGLAAWRLHLLIDYIETRLAERITSQDLADRIDMSVGQLFRAFRVSVGASPFQYIIGRRVELACVLMKTTREPLSQVAIACGLCDQSHLCRVFRRALGMSPAAWRRANVGNPEHQKFAAPDCGSPNDLFTAARSSAFDRPRPMRTPHSAP
jgi:AraC family transcriptional regulator